MRDLQIATLRRTCRPLIGSSAILLMLALLSISLSPTLRVQASGKQEAAAPESTQATFPGTGVGAIPDSPGGTPPVYGTPLVINFPVTGINAPLGDVSLNLTLTHSWVGDLDMVLAAPGGSPSLVVVGHIGVTAAASFGDSSNYGGTYTFTDSAPSTAMANIWSVALGTNGNPACADACAVTPGSYRTTARGAPGQTSPAPVTSLNTTFGGLTTGQINGTWTLTIRDGGGGDTGSVTAANLNLTTAVTPQHVVDFDGDGKTDLAVVRNTGGGPSGQITWFILQSASGTLRAQQFGLNDDVLAQDDYDGDNKTDIAVYRPQTGVWYVLQSTGGTLTATTFGLPDDILVPDDYDGDGKADVAVFRPSNGTWYILRSTQGFFSVQFGLGTDVVVPGDYNGDGLADVAVWRPSNGTWYTSTNPATNYGAVQWGANGDTVAPGDYDGDGKADRAVVRAASGNLVWYVLRSSDGSSFAQPFGLSASDELVEGDYDGDGKTDLAIWRPNANPSSTAYFIQESSVGLAPDSIPNANPRIQAFGQSGDKAVGYVPEH